MHATWLHVLLALFFGFVLGQILPRPYEGWKEYIPESPDRDEDPPIPPTRHGSTLDRFRGRNDNISL